MKRMCLALAGLAIVLVVAPEARASVIIKSIGNTTSPFAPGSLQVPAVFTAQQTGPAPFDQFYGADGGGVFDQSWTFTFAIPVGEAVTGGSVKFGINDLDSAATGSQVGLFQLNSGDNLTSVLDGLSEAAASVNRQYNEFTLLLTPASLTQLNLGTATFHLALLAPGLGILPGGTVGNGAALLFSTLTLQTETIPGGGPNPTVPEPTTLVLVASGLVAALRPRMARKRA